MFVEGIIIVADLDRFDEFVEEHGLSRYRPNDITGTLTHLFYNFTTRWRGVVIYGLDFGRGTEEIIIEIPVPDELDNIVNELKQIKKTINGLGASITIVVVKDYVSCRPARNRREAYYGTPGRRRATRLLKSVKRKGGNTIYIEV